jgi:hypothetical protein
MTAGSAKGIEQTVAALRRMTLGQLRERYLEAFGEPSRSGNSDFLFKRIAWRCSRWRRGRCRSGRGGPRRAGHGGGVVTLPAQGLNCRCGVRMSARQVSQ